MYVVNMGPSNLRLCPLRKYPCALPPILASKSLLTYPPPGYLRYNRLCKICSKADHSLRPSQRRRLRLVGFPSYRIMAEPNAGPSSWDGGFMKADINTCICRCPLVIDRIYKHIITVISHITFLLSRIPTNKSICSIILRSRQLIGGETQLRAHFSPRPPSAWDSIGGHWVESPRRVLPYPISWS